MKRFFYPILFSAFGIFCFLITFPVSAQNRPGNESRNRPASSPRENISENRRQALVLDIESRVLGEEKRVVWTETNRKISLPGVPTGIQLVGSNIVVAVQFTPYVRRDGNVLVAQGQIWVADETGGVTYYTSMQTIPIEYGEPIYFYPLGSSEHLTPSIEIMLTVNLYNDANSSTEAVPNPRNGR
ncbi:MAG: hypothetical protein LBI12_03560 [Treponema sp.]|jgi:hypothetical protein|nr:hypothetical protein [Treponema sp.]